MHACNTHVRSSPNRLRWGNEVASYVEQKHEPHLKDSY